MNETNEQLTIFPEEIEFGGCSKCACRDCLMWWSARCPFGECYDDHRAEVIPYDKAHPGEPPRTTWTDWKTDQAFWCRGGVCYPQEICEHYVHYTGQTVEECLCSMVSRFQDGYILCSIIDTVGCTACYERFTKTKEGL